ncbi:hypothetical protein MJG53_001368 [Ovis ammon polii x Ovis aries]|uniref:Uncharacterized protein n=2 Tax=Ovis TaxID=9935 RepID=A0A836AP98_SHEEP|nr:hypothetical protein JEQ12_000883 [Ovis aries]KAI4590319.1 hypothetical protein MJG53_001368 [Ovis ammon polii x Ovis aries]
MEFGVGNNCIVPLLGCSTWVELPGPYKRSLHHSAVIVVTVRIVLWSLWVKDGEASSVSMTRFEEKMKVELWSWLPSQGEVVQQPQEGNISGCEESSQVYCRLKCGEASSVSMMGFEEKMKSNARGCKHQNHVKSDLFLFGDYNWVKDGEASSVSMTRFEEKMKVELWSWLPSQGEVVQQPQEGNISGCEESSQVYCRLKCGEASSVSMIGFEEKMKVEL